MTRASYDIVAASYAQLIPDAHDGRPLDAAIMRAFAELAGDPIGDLGCGTGRITQHLHELGKDAFGIDLSEGMLDQARKLYPHLTFTQGDHTKLDLEDNSLGGHLLHAVRNATEAGFNEVARLQRQKGVDEKGPQAFLLLSKRNPAAASTS